VRIVTLPGVFRPISDSWLLADALEAETLPPGARVLDLCSGSGAIAISAARRAEVTAVDVSRRAVATIRLNALLNRVKVRAVRGDLLDAVAGERFDAIVSNPPYVPAPSDELPAGGPERAWDAGRDGRALLDRICRQAPLHLRPGGVLLVTVPVVSRICDPPLTDHWRFTPLSVRRLMEEAFGGGTVTVAGRGNVLTQIAFLEGLAAEDLTAAELAVDDERFPLVVCGRAVRAA
jgi:HemK-related putative methylase